MKCREKREKRGEERIRRIRGGGQDRMVRRSIIGRSSGYLPAEQKDEERAKIFGQIKG